MPQGSSKLRKVHRKGCNAKGKGGRRASKTRKGGAVKKPKNAALASQVNKQKKITAQIVSGIEHEIANKLQKNGGDLTTVKKSINSTLEAVGKAARFKPRKQFKL